LKKAFYSTILETMKKHKKENRFIGAFVNEMYAILLGIGIGNILFVQKLDLSSLFESGMGLFVTLVILIYWWDWTEYIGDNVVSTKREFIIDFLILINLEILFLLFNNPVSLSVGFIILGTLDLLWVLNYVFEKSDNYRANTAKWIAEKLFSIALFSGIWMLEKYVLKNNHNLMQGGVLIGAFCLSRLISFNQLFHSASFNLVPATLEDYDSIVKINNSYLNPEGKKAFLISELTIEKIKKHVSQGNTFYVLKMEKNDSILAFAELSTAIAADIIEKVEWNSIQQEMYFKSLKNDLLYIEKVAVSPGFKSKGYGKAVYKNLFQQYPDKSFYAFVMSSPHNNQISIRFHSDSGFSEAGKFNSKEFEGFKNYSSILFCRQKTK
jgi:L-amino acid N-acyltransferase YncA